MKARDDESGDELELTADQLRALAEMVADRATLVRLFEQYKAAYKHERASLAPLEAQLQEQKAAITSLTRELHQTKDSLLDSRGESRDLGQFIRSMHEQIEENKGLKAALELLKAGMFPKSASGTSEETP